MRTRRYLQGKMLLLLMAAAMLSGCTQEKMDGGEPLPEGKYPLEFTTQMYGMEVTRATSGNVWDGGEEIALKVAGSDTRKYTVSDKSTGKITAASGVTPFYWTLRGETKTVSAYYPYTLASASTITVNSAQDNAANYQASDALYANNSIAFESSEKKLTFKHLPAKVVANLKAGDGVTTTEVQGATVSFVNQSLTAPFDNATGKVTAASPGSSSIAPNVATTASGFQKSVQALLVPCQMENKQFIKVKIGSDEFYYTPTGDTDGNIESGKGYTYEITVKRDGIEVKPQIYQWTDGGSENVQSRCSMSFKIDLTSYSASYTLPFRESGSTGNYTLTVDWGDGLAITTINPNTSISSGITHPYSTAKEYTITITTTQDDLSEEQIPGFKPGDYYNNNNNNNLKLKSLLTPLLNTGDANIYYSFSECSNLTGPIPIGLFDNNQQVINISYCFKNCSNLTGTIPTGLFDKNPKVAIFSGCFSGCSNLTGTIPTRLFDKNPEVITFDYCFAGCTKLTMNSDIFCNEATAKTTRFAGKDINFAYCFQKVGSDLSSAGVAPELWTYTGTFFQSGCFEGVGTTTNTIDLGWQ